MRADLDEPGDAERLTVRTTSLPESAADDRGQRTTVIHCPTCQLAIELGPDATDVRSECPHCGQRLRLASTPRAAFGLQPGMTVGRFVLEGPLGRGGFGTVWRATDPRLDRAVAIKLPNRTDLTALEAELFLREARAGAQVRHPNVVSVHEVGRDGDQIYLVSDLVEGETLEQRLQQAPPRVSQAVEWCETLAQALQAVHEQGVIHRDLKPSNVLLDRQEVPYLTDFGLAHRDAGELSITDEGQLIGTTAYLSPEQVSNKTQAVDRRSDLFSLGTVFYRMLTGELPFRGAPHAVLKQIVDDDPVSPRKLNPLISKDIETVCLKCLEKQPQRRFSSAAELVAELGRIRRGAPIRSRHVGTAGRIVRWSWRHPLHLISGLMLLAIVVAGPLLALREHAGRKRAAAAEAQALQLVREGEARELVLRRVSYASNVAQAAAALNDGDAGRAKVLLEKDLPVPGRADLRGFEWRHLWKRCHEGLLHTIMLDHPIDRIVISPDGTYAIVARNAYSASSSLTVVDLTSGHTITREPGTGEMSMILLDASSRRVLAAARRGGILAWSPEQPPAVHYEQSHAGEVIGVFRLPNTSELLTVDNDGLVRIWSAEPVSRTSSWQLADDLVCHDAAVSFDGRLLAVIRSPASSLQFPQLTMFDVATHTVRWTRKLAHNWSRSGLAFTPDGATLATAGHTEGGPPKFWDALTGELRPITTDHAYPCDRVNFSPSGEKLAGFNQLSNNVYIWDVKSGRRFDVVLSHERVTSVAWLSENTLVTAGWDGCLRRWAISAATHVRTTLHGVAGEVLWYGAGSPDGWSLATVSDRDVVQLWDLRQRKLMRTFSDQGISQPCITNDQTIYAKSLDGRRVLQYDPTRDHSEVMYSADDSVDDIPAIAISNDQQSLAIAESPRVPVEPNCEGGIVLVEPKTREFVRWPMAPEVPYRLVFNADSDRLCTLMTSGRIELRSVVSPGIRSRVSDAFMGGKNSNPLFVAVTHDEERAIVGDNAGNLYLSDLKIGRRERSISGRGRSANQIVITGDAGQFAVAFGNKTVAPNMRGEIGFWYVDNEQPIIYFGQDLPPCVGLAMTSDGTQMTSVHFTGQIVIWDGASDAEVAKQRSRLVRSRTRLETE